MLICNYIEDETNFNLSEALNKVVYIYNNTRHKAIKYKPIDIFYSSGKNLFSIIKENTISSSKNYNVKEDFLEVNDLVLLYNNFSFNYIKKNGYKILEKSKI